MALPSDQALEAKLLSNPKVAEAMREAGENALHDPKVQQAIVEQAKKQMTQENAEAVAKKVKEWAKDPEVQAKARHFAGMAMEGAGQVGQKFVGCIEQGPAGVQLLAFFAATASCALAVLNLLNIPGLLVNPVAYLVSAYLFTFALSTMLFEAKPEWIESLGGPLNSYQDLLLEYCKFFALSGGRGMFYIFQGSLWLCGAALDRPLQLLVGLSLVFVGVLHALMHFGVMPQDVALKMKKVAGRSGGYEPISNNAS